MADFDPYFKWLGIPPEEQPPNHYRLLGIPLFSSDPEVIQNAVDQRMAHLRTMQVGPRAALAEQMLNQIMVAQVCLFDPARKAENDRELRAIENSATTPLAPPVVEQFRPSSTRPSQTSRRRQPAFGTLLKVVLGGVAGIIAAAAILRFGFGIDPFRSAPEQGPARPSHGGPTIISNAKNSPAKRGGVAVATMPPEATGDERPSPWSYGYGALDSTSGRIVEFQHMSHFKEGRWVDGTEFPNGPWKWAFIGAHDLHPSPDPNRVVVRRWTSPIEGPITIRSKLSLYRPPPDSDGVRVYVVSSSAGLLWQELLTEARDWFTVASVEVMPGETIDFCADCYRSDGFDGALWIATVEGQSPMNVVWDSLRDFTGPSSANNAVRVPRVK